jgi:argininosuccinate lyase
VSGAGGADAEGQLWAGRFTGPPAPEAHALGRSLAFDRRLARFDVEASIAHVLGLRDAGLLGADEAEQLVSALGAVGAEIDAGAFEFDERDEDVHSSIERAVTQRCGDLGAKLHAGRSRNDLVVTDLRLWSLAAGRRIRAATVTLASTLVDRAREHAADAMPGTTHTRPAQPVTLGHHLLAHAWALARDLERLEQWDARTSTSTLGAGALATSTLGIDAAATAKRLGFARPFANSIDAVSDRDFAQEFVGVAAIEAAHLSRVAADLVRWTDPALGWAEMDEAYSTGSSMMPQKRNPDAAELGRAKAARVGSDFVALIALVQGLPAGYHRDLQEDKEPVFDAADTLELVLPALAGAVRTVRFDVDAMRAACADPGLYATDLAETLVKDGVPFRDAHRRTGELLKRLDAEGRGLRDLSAEEWAAFGLPEGPGLLDADQAIVSRGGPGGPSPASVIAQAEALGAALDAAGVHLGERD